MANATITVGFTAGDRTNSTVEQTGQSLVSVTAEVAASTSDSLISDQNIDVSKLKCLLIVSTQDGVLETNSSSSPAQTFNLQANVPIVWFYSSEASYPSNPLTTDVTALYFTNSSTTTAATVKIRGNLDTALS